MWNGRLYWHVNTLRPRQNGRHFADDIFKWIFLNENVWIPIKISLKFVPQGPINNIPALVQIMAWRRPGDKPLSGSMMVRSPTHICVTRPQWVKVWVTVFISHKSRKTMTTFEFHWSFFPRVQLTIRQHWFRYWLGAGQATSYYVNQCWLSSPMHRNGTRGMT